MPASDTYRERAATLAGGILKQHARDVDTSGRFPRESIAALGPELLGMCVPAEFVRLPRWSTPSPRAAALRRWCS